MDLGIRGRTAIVCGASKGLGLGSAQALASEGVNVLMVARTEETLQEAAAQVQASFADVTITHCAADLSSVEGRDAVFAACTNPDILVANAGGPPVKDFRQLTEQDWVSALNSNLYGMTDLINRAVTGMCERGFGRVVTITSASVKMPMVGLDLSNAMRSGLVSYCKGISAGLAQHNVTINGLLPGLHATERLDGIFVARSAMMGKTPSEVEEMSRNQIPAKRFGTAEEFGQFCAFLCSEHAGYMTGQTVLLDGGAYTGLA
ncbi:MAG: SDR family oxidoreductase [Halieaceae bacterium]|jgi:3-oxoacyl-[acyl-carrier protein] reductase|nr:SDR family oxidoreductase [Halieaceae bacterium]